MVIGDKLTIEFWGYQGPVDSNDMNYCVRAANNDIIHKVMADQRESPMGLDPYLWSSGNVALCLSPGYQLTWGKWSLVPAAIEKFMTENELKGTQFNLLWHELGPIGYGQLITTSGAQSPETKTTANAFPDPFDRDIASIGLTIEFYGYQGSISPIAMKDCISAASSDVVQHLVESEAPMTMESLSYAYSAGGVHLSLFPTDQLTWHMWAFIPIWIQEFVTENEFKGTQFILLWEGFGPVGMGQLVSTPTGAV